MNIQLNLTNETAKLPAAKVLALDSDGRRFIVLEMGGATLILPGFGLGSVAYAERVIAALESAICAVRQ